MSDHRDEDITPLEYFISGLVILLFGLLYFFINHGKDFMSSVGYGTPPLSAPVVMSTTETDRSNRLLADDTGEAKKLSANDSDKGAEAGDKQPEDEGQPEQTADLKEEAPTETGIKAGPVVGNDKDKEQQRLQAEKAKSEQAEKDRVAAEAEKALREQLAAERERAAEVARKLEDTQKLLAAEKARNAEAAKKLPVEQALAQQLAPAVSDTSGSNADADQQQVYKLPDGTEIPVSDEGFEGTVKAAMAEPSEDGVALMNEPMLFDDVSFESGSAQLRASSQKQIRALAALMNTYQDRKILIRGHTDNIGGLNANSLLSISRSDSMKKQLVSLGIDRSRIKLEGVGQLEPLASNATAEGRSKNRRIELILVE